MEKLNTYLQELLNKCGSELRLEPNKNPYIITTSGQMDVSPTALPGTQINSMIFALIPNDVKQQLPNQPEIDFVHPHNLGPFYFCVKKSPAGFNVTISPASDEQKANLKREPEPVDQEPLPVANTEAVSPVVPEADDAPVAAEEPVSSSPVENADTDTAEENAYESDEYPGSESAYQTTYDSTVADSQDAGDDFEIEYLDENSAESYGDYQSESQHNQNVNPGNSVPLDAMPVGIASDYGIQSSETSSDQVPAAQETEMNFNQPAPAASELNTPQHDSANTTFTPAHADPRSEMDALFVKMAEEGASDLHLSVSVPPMIRMDGKMRELAPNMPKMTQENMKALLSSIMPESNLEEFEERNDTDFAYEIAGLARFRANIFRDRKGMGGVFRIIPSDIMTAEDLKLSKSIMNLCELSKGLVVVTGPTGSGKSTTLCAMVDSINKKREDHLITIEDPIEFTHENQKCLVNQREVHNHTNSFKNALRAALREDPDIILVGEMRDLETISIAIETAETGHLVFGTLHTTTAASTVDRIIDQFPADRQQQIRVMLSESLKGVIAQTLLPKIGGGRIAALEVLIVTPAIANLIREGKTFQIPSQMQTGKNLGMQMLNDSLMDLVNKGLVEPKDAYVKAVDKDGFESLLTRNGKKL